MEFLLHQRKFKLIDDELFSFYKKGFSKTEKWHKIKLTLHHTGYKTFAFNIEGKIKNFQYHRVVYYANNPQWDIYDSSKNNFIDHVDGIRTNTHISNLRVVTHQENLFNTKAKGYYFNKARGKYQAQIVLNGKEIYLGRYDTEDDAREAYLNKKAELHIIQQR